MRNEMRKHIYALGVITVIFSGGCSNQNAFQTSVATVGDNHQRNILNYQELETSVDVIVDTYAEVVAEGDWYTESVAVSSLGYQWEGEQTGYAISDEELPDSGGDLDFGFYLSDLRYDVVKALVKKIFHENHYTSYEFYKYSKENDGTWQYPETDLEYFVVVYDSNYYWLINYCQGKAYALHDDAGLYARERSAKALSLPGEEVLFGFPLKDSSEWVVICGEESNRNYLACRMGIPQDKNISLEYSQNKSDSVEDNLKSFTYKFGTNESKKEPKDGDILYKDSLIYEDETFIYTILEEGIYQERGTKIELSLQVENKQTGNLKYYEGKGELSETTGSFGRRIYERYDFINVVKEDWYE